MIFEDVKFSFFFHAVYVRTLGMVKKYLCLLALYISSMFWHDLFSINRLNIDVYVQNFRIIFVCIILVYSVQQSLYSIYYTLIIRARKFMHLKTHK
jgi:hypothetical protein